MKRSHRIIYGLNIVLIASLLLAGCGRKPAEERTRLPQPAVNTVAPARAAVTSAPTAAPAPPPLPPTVTAMEPAQGQEQALDAPITITFDQPMDPSTTTRAFRLEPDTPGKLSVAGRTLTFVPDGPLARATEYRATVGTTAKAANGLTLSEAVLYPFRTVGFVAVASTQPSDGQTDVAVDSPITVAFDRPIVPLTGVEGQAALPQPLDITPAVTGQGEWLNTGIYQFTPAEGLAASTTYTVTVKAGLEDISGSVLESDHSFTFRTTDPTILAWQPENNLNVPVQSAISVTFSMAMDRASTEEAFSLRREEGDAVPGAFTWSDDGRVLGFRAQRTLDFGARYRAEVDASALAANRQGTLRPEANRVFAFRTVALPKVVRTDPRDGTLKADPGGGVTIYFESPMDPASFVTESVTVLPKPTRVMTGYNPYENVLWVDFGKEPATPYTVTLSGKVADPYGNLLGRDEIITFRTDDYDPMLQLNSDTIIGTYNAYTDTEAVVTYRNVPEIRLALYRATLDDLLTMTGPDWWSAWDRYAPRKSDLIREWTEQATARPNRIAVLRTPITDTDGEQLPPGVYYLALGGAADVDRTGMRRLLARTDLNVVLKAGTNEALAWVTDMKSGQPVPGVDVRFYARGRADLRAVTDADGLARLPEMAPRKPWEALAAVATTTEGRFGISSSDWQTGISPWDFGLQGGVNADPFNAYVYTDRPIYRPGQTVQWKAIVRRDEDAHYSMPAPGQAVTITINDDRGNVLFDQALTLGPQGSVDGSLALDESATLGFYYVSARMTEDTSFGVGFQVAEYRKPEYELTAATDRPEYIQGEQINLTSQASYFFGGPVKDAKVRWVLLSSDQYFAPPGLEGYSFGDWEWYENQDSGPFGRELSQGEGRTDANGGFTVSVPADISQFKQSQRLTFDVTITDANNQPVSTQTTAVVHKGAFYVGLRPQQYVATVGAPQKLDVLTVNPQGRPVANTEVTLVVNQVEWRSVREQAEDGRFYWVTRAKKTAVMTDTLTTNAHGEAVLDWTPEAAGEVKIEATARDRSGHALRSAAWVWVSGPEYVPWRQENNDRIQLIPDRNEYAVGDTARVLVASPYQGAVKALLTTERSSILSHDVIELRGNSQVLEIPITAAHAPNAFVSVVLVQGMDAANPAPSFRVGLAQLNVSVADKELRVEVTPRATAETPDGSPQAGPRERVTYDVLTLDQAGQPVSAEVSLALVDKALLTLADDQAGTLMSRFYSQRPLGVQTSSTLVVNVNRLVAQVPEGGKGGGGGGGGDSGGGTVRREFLDVAFWDATVTTDAAGRAEVEVTLPDNLTTWTMDARAANHETLVGQTKTDLVATKPLLLRPSLPRFFVEGDRAEIGAVVQNTTDRALEVALTLAGDGLDGDEAARQDVTVPAQGSIKAVWPVTVGGPGESVVVRFNAEARAARLSDAVEVTLPLLRYSTPEVTATSGEVDADEIRLEGILPPADADPSRGGLEVVLEPSLSAGMRGALTYLQHYPYECVEQTMSRFLPNVVSYTALQELGVARPGLESELRQQIAVGLQRIYAKQHIDGGWGWWQTDASNPAVSAYVVFGLAKAQQSRIAVDPLVLEKGVRFLRGQLQAAAELSEWQANQQAFMLYALAEAGAPEPNRAGALYEQREKLSLYAKAYLALALERIGDDAAPTRIATLLQDISGQAVTSATSTHWEERFTDYWNMNTDARTTAIVLDALARLDPDNPLAPNAVRWLMSVRKAARWETTQENAWAIMALTDWMTATGELQGDYAWTARLNGAELGDGRVTPETVEDTTVLQAEIARLALDQTNALELERGVGPGKLYYSAYLRTYLPVEELEPLSRGVTVSRQFRLADCGETDATDCPPITAARVGDVLNVTVDIVVPEMLHYLIVEDPLPAGLEALDTSLRTTSVTAAGPEMTQQDEAARPAWWWTPTDVELRDEKTAMFATELEPGSYRFTYQVRATLPGEFLTLPPTAYQMYFPEVWGRGAGSTFRVTE